MLVVLNCLSPVAVTPGVPNCVRVHRGMAIRTEKWKLLLLMCPSLACMYLYGWGGGDLGHNIISLSLPYRQGI